MLCFRKSLWIRGGREYQDFPSKIFCLTVPKNFVGKPICAVFQKKFMDKRGGSIKSFRRKIFTHRAEIFGRGRGESYSVSIISGNENFFGAEDYVTIVDFLSSFSVSQS